MSNESSNLPPLIAVVGCDGSGKSTVSGELLVLAKCYGPAATAHLGKQQGNSGRWFARLPFVGGWFERLIERKASGVQSSRGDNKAPELFPAIVMYAFTLRRVRRFRKMMQLRKKGLIIIADRYPQLDIPSASDGPDMSVTAQGSHFVHSLAQREQTAFEWMTSYQPDLVIRLNVDLDMACARKPDHLRAVLKRKQAIVPLLTFNNAKIVEIDANLPLNEVLASAKSALECTMAELSWQRTEAYNAG